MLGRNSDIRIEPPATPAGEQSKSARGQTGLVFEIRYSSWRKAWRERSRKRSCVYRRVKQGQPAARRR